MLVVDSVGVFGVAVVVVVFCVLVVGCVDGAVLDGAVLMLTASSSSSASSSLSLLLLWSAALEICSKRCMCSGERCFCNAACC